MENLRVSERMQRNLLKSMKWLKFLTVVGTVAMILMAIMGVAVMAVDVPGMQGMGVMAGIIYLGIAAIYIFPLKRCYGIVNNIRQAFAQDDQQALEMGFEHTLSVLHFFSILAITVLAFYGIIIVATVFGAVFGSLMAG